MKKVSTFFTVISFMFNLYSNAAYDHGKNPTNMISQCTNEKEINPRQLENSLRNKYKKDIGSEIMIYGATLKDYRPALVSLFIRLTSRSEEDHQYKNSEIFKDQTYKQCQDVICLTDKVFGEGLGAYYLYILDNYNLNLSHLDNGIGILDKTKDRHHRVTKFKPEELRAILIPLKMLPISSLKRIKFNYPLKRIKRHKGSTIANATMHLFNLWGSIPTQDKIITIIHELGHVLADTISDEGADTNKEWASFSNWTWDRDKTFAIYDARRDYSYNNYVSPYAKQNPVEDFAESFTAFVVNPSYLLKKAPRKFDYIKEKVFGGLEYSNLYCKFDNESHDFSKELSLLKEEDKNNIAKECEYGFTLTMESLDMYPFNSCIAKSLLGQEELPLNNAPNSLQRQFTDNKTIKEIKAKIVDLIIGEEKTLDEMDRLPQHILNYMRPGLGKYGYSSELSAINKHIHRWMHKRLEAQGLEKNDHNARKAIKEILLQRAK